MKNLEQFVANGQKAQAAVDAITKPLAAELAALVRLFDAAADVGCYVDVFENHRPGAADALRRWAADRGLAIKDGGGPGGEMHIRCEFSFGSHRIVVFL